MGKYSFHKSERLKREKLIQELFEKGSSFNLYPFRIIYLLNSHDPSFHQVLFTVSSRSFKKAVERNKIKRRTREAYRLNKNSIAETPTLLIGFIYTARVIEDYIIIEKAMLKALERLKRQTKYE